MTGEKIMSNNQIRYLNIPGLRNSTEKHWQSIWENSYPDQFARVVQQDWDRPDRDAWVPGIEQWFASHKVKTEDIVLIGHSIGCATIMHWLSQYNHQIKGALLVAPSDPDEKDYPSYITGFSPIPLVNLHFPSIVIASSDDHVVSTERAKYFASSWGSEYHEIANAGHIEPGTGYGEFQLGLNLLQTL